MMDIAYSAIHQPSSPRFTDAAVGFFRVFGGPVAWFVELCAGFALATQPCLIDGVPMTKPASVQWAGPTTAVLMGIAVLVALFAVVMAWHAFKRARIAIEADEPDSMDAGVGRAQFLALWGILLGCVFALATAMTAVGFLVLPRCAQA